MKSTLKLIVAVVTMAFYVIVSSAQTRTEKDLLGEKKIPNEAYYGG